MKHHRRDRGKLPNRQRSLEAVVGIILLGLFLFPLYWMVATSVTPVTLLAQYPPPIIPPVLDFGVWQRRILSDSRIWNYFLNSLLVSVGSTTLTLGLAAPASYGLAHLPLRGKTLILLISLTSLMLPSVMLATPLFILFHQVQLINTYLGLILANTTLALPLAITMLRPFFLAIPTQLTDAALIDGCNRWGAFGRVILPLATPGLLTTGIFVFLLGWGELVLSTSLLNVDQLRPVTAGLWYFIGSGPIHASGALAFSSLVMLPTALLFLYAQRYIIAGLTDGALNE